MYYVLSVLWILSQFVPSDFFQLLTVPEIDFGLGYVCGEKETSQIVPLTLDWAKVSLENLAMLPDLGK